MTRCFPSTIPLGSNPSHPQSRCAHAAQVPGCMFFPFSLLRPHLHRFLPFLQALVSLFSSSSSIQALAVTASFPLSILLFHLLGEETSDLTRQLHIQLGNFYCLPSNRDPVEARTPNIMVRAFVFLVINAVKGCYRPQANSKIPSS